MVGSRGYHLRLKQSTDAPPEAELGFQHQHLRQDGDRQHDYDQPGQG